MLGASARHADVPPVVIEPAAGPLAPVPHLAGTGVLGSVAEPPDGPGPTSVGGDGVVIVDGEPRQLRLERFDAVHAVLVEGHADAVRTPVLLLPDERTGRPGLAVARSSSTAGGSRSRSNPSAAHRSASALVGAARQPRMADRPRSVPSSRAGCVSVSVVAGDAVAAGQQLLVVEAMKMQNELRAPRDGVIARVAVGAGQTIDVGDLLLVLG